MPGITPLTHSNKNQNSERIETARNEVKFLVILYENGNE
jgi:hypothetical protein